MYLITALPTNQSQTTNLWTGFASVSVHAQCSRTKWSSNNLSDVEHRSDETDWVYKNYGRFRFDGRMMFEYASFLTASIYCPMPPYSDLAERWRDLQYCKGGGEGITH